MIKMLPALLLSSLIYLNTSAQNINVKKNPVWIDMMSNENTNYFEAVKAFDAYWSCHEKPLQEESELMGDGETKINEFSKKFSKKKRKELEEYRWMSYQVKRFEHWKTMVLPYVQTDGNILSSEEQVKLWEQLSDRTAK